MTHVTCRLTAKNRDRLRNPTLGNRVWASFFYLSRRQRSSYSATVHSEITNRKSHIATCGSQCFDTAVIDCGLRDTDTQTYTHTETDTQTDRHTDTAITILRSPIWSGVTVVVIDAGGILSAARSVGRLSVPSIDSSTGGWRVCC